MESLFKMREVLEMKSEKKRLEVIADNLWSDLVKKRDEKCKKCGSVFGLSAHHIRVRQHKSTKYDIDNGIALCRDCHSLQKFRPEQFHDMIIDIIGQPKYNELRLRSLVEIHDKYYGMKYGVKFLRFIIERLKND
jgi:hypothetical protein